MSLAVLSVMFTACTPDPVDPVAPTLSIDAGTGFVADGDEVFTEATFDVKITASQGDDLINRIEVLENGSAMDASRILLDGDPAGSNPSPVAESFGTGFSWVITITAPATAGETNTYSIKITDAGGQTAQVSLDIVTADAAPVLTIADETGFVNGGDSVFTATDFTLKVTGTKGSGDLDQVEVQENGVTIAADRLMINGAAATANPFAVAASELETFTYEISVTAPADVDQQFTYTILATDVNGQIGSVSAELTTVEAPTPLTESVEILLLNQGGPAGTGGLDLETGNSVGSTDATADILDKGIDINKPLDQNWNQKIGPANSADLRLPDAAFNYDEISTLAELEAAFDLGTTITESDVVQIGDQFLVLSEGSYYALVVTAINLTAADNGDYYQFSVKQ